MSLKIIKAGLLDTVQDGGRRGYQHLGINPGGVMDRFAASLTNALLGKELQAPVIEMHFPAPKFLFQKKAIICLAGAHFTPMINGEEVPMHQPLAINENSILSFRGRQKGSRCYLAITNEIEIKPWLNSYSTNLKATAGGYNGKALRRNDELDFAETTFTTSAAVTHLPWRYSFPETNLSEIQFIPGPEWNWLTVKSQTGILNNSFTITQASDRMGYRLQGDVLEQANADQLVSSPVTFGTVQLLPNGQLIILMADHQTTGGYPRIATVISAHLPLLAQMPPGEKLHLVMTTSEEAEESWIEQQKLLGQLQNTCNLKLQNWIHAHRH